MSRYLLLTGGVGGAKLCDGFYRSTDPEQLCMLINTGDDFEHCGLTVCPDIDTLLYSLSGESDTQRGWGMRDETWTVLERLGQLGGDTWFQLGDRDLATHLRRTALLAQNRSLEEVTAVLAAAMGINATLLPMCNEPLRTLVHSTGEVLAFQDYFVRRRCEPRVERIEFAGAESARPPERLAAVLADPQLRKIVLCPSNPFVSIAPVLAVPGMLEALHATAAPVFAVSPIVGGRALKGPAAAMLDQLGYPVSALGVAQYYAATAPGFVDVFVIDEEDRTLQSAIEALGMECRSTATVMRDGEDRRRLAQWILDAGYGH